MTISAFDSKVFPQGLHLSRCRIPMDLGVWEAATAATFRQGQLVSLDSSGQVVLCTGLNFFGVAKWTKDLGVGNAVAVDEPVVLSGTTVTSLRRGAVVGTSVSNNSIKVSLTAGGAALTNNGTDYTVDSLANGTLHRIGGGAISDGATVFVTYTYGLTSADMAFQGQNFWNGQDDVTIQGGRVAVVQDFAVLFSTEYVTDRRYQVNERLYAGQTDTEDQGRVTNLSSEGDEIGRVIQVPTATDPYLGWELIPGGAAGA